MFVNIPYKAFCLFADPYIQIFSVVCQLEKDLLDLSSYLFRVAFQDSLTELVLKQLINLQDGFFNDRELLNFNTALCEFSLFWAASW